MKTISKSRVLSSALVAELKVLYVYIQLIKILMNMFIPYTASIKQKMKGPHKSPITILIKLPFQAFVEQEDKIQKNF
jgi:hypothetical protein